jgi:hypothetical protein
LSTTTSSRPVVVVEQRTTKADQRELKHVSAELHFARFANFLNAVAKISNQSAWTSPYGMCQGRVNTSVKSSGH